MKSKSTFWFLASFGLTEQDNYALSQPRNPISKCFNCGKPIFNRDDAYLMIYCSPKCCEEKRKQITEEEQK